LLSKNTIKFSSVPRFFYKKNNGYQPIIVDPCCTKTGFSNTKCANLYPKFAHVIVAGHVGASEIVVNPKP
jgi:hypothetical protein